MIQYVNSIQEYKLICPNSLVLNYYESDQINEITIINKSLYGINGVYLSINQSLNYNSPDNTILQIAPNDSFTINGKNKQIFVGAITIYANHSAFYVSGIEYGIFTVIKKQLINAEL